MVSFLFSFSYMHREWHLNAGYEVSFASILHDVSRANTWNPAQMSTFMLNSLSFTEIWIHKAKIEEEPASFTGREKQTKLESRTPNVTITFHVRYGSQTDFSHATRPTILSLEYTVVFVWTTAYPIMGTLFHSLFMSLIQINLAVCEIVFAMWI